MTGVRVTVPIVAGLPGSFRTQASPSGRLNCTESVFNTLIVAVAVPKPGALARICTGRVSLIVLSPTGVRLTFVLTCPAAIVTLPGKVIAEGKSVSNVTVNGDPKFALRLTVTNA